MIAWIVLGAALVLGVPGVVYLAQDGMLFLPQPGPASLSQTRGGRAVEDLAFTAEDGVVVRGWLVRSARTPAPLIVYYGGNAEEVSWQAGEPWPVDWSLALVNYRGYGQSEGKPSEQTLFADAEIAFDALAARADVDRSRIVLVGRSLGSGVATYVASRRQVAGVVLISPYDSVTALAQRHYPFLPVRLLLKHPFDSLPRARDQGAAAGDRGRARRNHPARAFAAAARRLGRSEALVIDPARRPQRPRPAARVLGPDRRVPRRSRPLTGSQSSTGSARVRGTRARSQRATACARISRGAARSIPPSTGCPRNLSARASAAPGRA